MTATTVFMVLSSLHYHCCNNNIPVFIVRIMFLQRVSIALAMQSAVLAMIDSV